MSAHMDSSTPWRERLQGFAGNHHAVSMIEASRSIRRPPSVDPNSISILVLCGTFTQPSSNGILEVRYFRKLLPSPYFDCNDL
jgi:hypothetical protein